MLKKWIVFAMLAAMVTLLPACGREQLADMSTEVNDRYSAILWEGRTYVPYCAISKSQCGEQIGIVNGDKNDRVWEYKGFSAQEWIINGYVSHLMDGTMLCREINVTEIPEGLQSEYEWNNEIPH